MPITVGPPSPPTRPVAAEVGGAKLERTRSRHGRRRPHRAARRRSRRASPPGCTTCRGPRGGSPPRAASSVRRSQRATRVRPAGGRRGPTSARPASPRRHRRTQSSRRGAARAARSARPARARRSRASRCSSDSYIATCWSCTSPSSTPARANPLSATWATTWARVHPGSSDGAASSSAVRASTVRMKRLRGDLEAGEVAGVPLGGGLTADGFTAHGPIQTRSPGGSQHLDGLRAKLSVAGGTFVLPPPAWRLVASVRMANTCSNHPTDTAGVSSVADQLVIRGAREHNLKDVSLDLPRDSLIVFTGLSGSGKSSLAFDTIFAEGQRRYVESLSAYARQFLGPDGQARRRLHRGPEPGGLDRPEVHVEEPALDRRHHHRGLRLPPAALRPRRAAALPRVRRPDRATDPAADRRPHPAARGGHPLPGARAGDPGPQGRVRRAVPQPAVAGLQPRPGQRRDDPARRSRPSWTSRRSTPSRWSSTGSPRSRPRSAGSPTRSRPRSTSPPGWWCSTSSTSTPRTRTRRCGSPSGWPAPTSTTSRPTSSSRGRSRSTRRSAPAPRATASAPGWRSTRSWSSPTPAPPSARA